MRMSMCLALFLATAPLAAVDVTLDGDWNVDLSARPDTPYIRPMTLALHADGSVSGRFYDSEIEAGRWTRDRGRLCASFRTSDGVRPYHTSVCANGADATGQTWAEHRDVLFNWNATRAPGAP